MGDEVTAPESHTLALVEVLIDDVRRFRDDRPCLVARTSSDGVRLLEQLRDSRIDHLWLDHDLIGDDDIWPVIRLLEDAFLEGRPFDIGMAHVQAARAGPAHRIVVSLRRCNYPVVHSTDLRMWSR